jgi:GAF domain-containing protein
MAIPLVASDRVLGILSIGASAPHAFTPEHFRTAKSLAIPAAVGIQNARIHELAAIYASELEVQLRTLNQTRKALEQSRSSATSVSFATRTTKFLASTGARTLASLSK